MQLVHRFIKFYIKLLNFISPEKAANFAFRLFQRTRKLKFRKRELEFFEKAETFSVPTAYGAIPCYELGKSSDELVFLVHGWESNAGSLGGIAYQLADEGYHVISVNLPAHGYHKATHTNLYECKEVLKTVIDTMQPSEPFSIVSHSFGSAVTAFALSETGYALNQLVFLTCPNQLYDIFKHFQDVVDLPQKPFEMIIEKVEEILDAPIQNLSVQERLKQVSYKKLTIIHDRKDKIISYSNAEAINEHARDSEIIPLNKAGHYRMLWNEDVYAHIRDIYEMTAAHTD